MQHFKPFKIIIIIIFLFIFFYVGPPKEDIFFWPPSMVYISVQLLQMLHISIWASEGSYISLRMNRISKSWIFKSIKNKEK